jgi:hypothetical protein
VGSEKQLPTGIPPQPILARTVARALGHELAIASFIIHYLAWHAHDCDLMKFLRLVSTAHVHFRFAGILV